MIVSKAYKTVDGFTVDIGELPKLAGQYVSLEDLGRGILGDSGTNCKYWPKLGPT
jgi:hypothetical protein